MPHMRRWIGPSDELASEDHAGDAEVFRRPDEAGVRCQNADGRKLPRYTQITQMAQIPTAETNEVLNPQDWVTRFRVPRYD